MEPFSIPFNKDAKFASLPVREWQISFREAKNNADNLKPFFQLAQSQEKLVSLSVENDISEENAKKIAGIVKEFDNVSIRLTDLWLTQFFEDCKVYLGPQSAATSWRTLTYLVQNLRVDSVYLADDLWYDMSKVKNYCIQHAVKIRLICNRIPVTTGKQSVDYTYPFFAPQDRSVLDNYVDLYEFDLRSRNLEHAEFKLLYDSWVKNKKFSQDLQILNKDLLFPVKNNPFPAGLSYKLTCRLACKKGYDCTVCDTLFRVKQ